MATVTLKDRRSLTIDVPASRGTPDNPLSTEALRAKFLALTEPILGRDQAEHLAEEVLRLEHLSSVAPLVDLAAPV